MTRGGLAGPVVAVLLAAAPADGGLPGPGRAGLDPLRSSAEISGQGAACQFRFHPDGGADILTVSITLRDPFDLPVEGCSTSVTLAQVGTDSFNFCTCCGPRKTGFSAVDGTLQLTWGGIGGFGTLEARVTTHCYGNINLANRPFDYTSTDLDGTCGSTGTASISDIALWARGLPPSPMWRPADWDCSGGSADIFDFGAWLGGYNVSCGACP